ncbi:lyase family protein [Stappia indica]|uniref:lyase family protein n=1 Tax=Stappia indica TaxID=538381 RepID=UPI001CD1DB47|nr:lyase family protein [Stappia indica]MCA1299519.1 3-carboxy-cis,cis-muconate cycloisomerase [Stappia indica]
MSSFTSPLYRDLFGDPETATLLDPAAELSAMIEVERALARVQARCGMIPEAAGAAIDSQLKTCLPNPADLAAGTASAGVAVPALVAALRDRLGEPGADYLHFGATSQDIVDSALMLRCARLLALYETRLETLIAALCGLACDHAGTGMAGRTRAQAATPISFGLRAANWARPLAILLARLRTLRRGGLPVQLGGASGDRSILGGDGRRVADALAMELGLAPSVPWMTDRRPIGDIAHLLSSLCTALGKIGADVLIASRSEIGEIRLEGAGGSSTMPQKQNPVAAEAVIALARTACGLASLIGTNGIHAEERDGAGWMEEWLVLPQLFAASGAALLRAGELVAALRPAPEAMAATLEASGGLLLAERLCFALLPHLGRAGAQALVKRAAVTARAEGTPLVAVVQALSDAPLDWAALADDAAGLQAAAAMTEEILAEIDAVLAKQA